MPAPALLRSLRAITLAEFLAEAVAATWHQFTFRCRWESVLHDAAAVMKKVAVLQLIHWVAKATPLQVLGVVLPPYEVDDKQEAVSEACKSAAHSYSVPSFPFRCSG